MDKLKVLVSNSEVLDKLGFKMPLQLLLCKLTADTAFSHVVLCLDRIAENIVLFPLVPSRDVFLKKAYFNFKYPRYSLKGEPFFVSDISELLKL